MKKTALIILSFPLLFFSLEGNKISAQTLEEYRIFAGNCYKGEIEKVKQYVGSGMSVNPPSGGPFSALYLSIMQNRFEIVTYLLKHGATPNYVNSDKTTPLMCVFLHYKNITNPLNYVDLLLNNNANVNAANGENVSTLDLAATSKNVDIIKALINKGAQTNKNFNISIDGKTYKYSSLTWLIANLCDVDVVKLYVSKGAPINSECSVDGSVFSAIDLAKQFSIQDLCYLNVVNYLKLKGAKPLSAESNGSRFLSINDVLKSMGLSPGSSALNSSNTPLICYTAEPNKNYYYCGVKVSIAYTIHCNKANKDHTIFYWPGGDGGEKLKNCVWARAKGWRENDHALGVDEAATLEAAAKKLCGCE